MFKPEPDETGIKTTSVKPPWARKQHCPLEVKMQIVSCAKEGRNWSKLADHLGIPRSTAYQWIVAVSRGETLARKKSINPLHGKEDYALRPEEIEHLHETVEKNPAMSIHAMHKAVQAKAQRKLTPGTVRYYLDNMIFRRSPMKRDDEGAQTSLAQLEEMRMARALGKEIVWIGKFLTNA